MDLATHICIDGVAAHPCHNNISTWQQRKHINPQRLPCSETSLDVSCVQSGSCINQAGDAVALGRSHLYETRRSHLRPRG